MSIIQFLRILVARRLLILLAMVSVSAGALLVAKILPPRWEASSRVMLNTIKPDPVTGLVLGAAARSFIQTQLDLVTDYRVAGQVADKVGWMSDPDLLAAYQKRSKNDDRDYRRWVADIVIKSATAKLLDGSNIMEISFTATKPRDARAVADALRESYVQTNFELNRDDASKNASWYESETIKAKAQLDAAANAKSQFERENGIYLQDDKTDVDSTRLRTLAGQASATGAATVSPSTSASSLQLAELDASIAEASKNLGPNHPELMAMKARRANLAVVVEKEREAARASAGADSAALHNIDRALKAQQSKVLAQSDKLIRLQQLQSEVDLRRDLFTKASARAADYRLQASVPDFGLTLLGSATTPSSPKFPNMLLIVPGSLVLGLAVGILVALIVEFFARRIRGPEDLRTIIDAPLIGIIERPAATGARSGVLGRLRGLVPRRGTMVRA
jgi:uncharacterized protein involved in exopolysaccharide biosynthesis